MNDSHKHNHDTADNIRTAFFLNLAFTIFEIVGGMWTNSLAILSDAVHDLGDSISLGVSWYLDKYSKKAEDQAFSYGYRRFSLLGALLNTIVLIAGSIYVLTQVVPRLIHPEHSNARGMMLFAVIGIVVNGLAVLRLKKSKSMNARMVAVHMMEDVLGWVAVLIVSITLLFTDIHILDPLLSLLIIIYVLYNVLGNLKKTVKLFLQAVPEGVSLEEIEKRLLGLENVQSIHHTHVWSMDGQDHVLTTHVVVDESASREDVLCIKNEINVISAQMDLTHTTVEIEYGDEVCQMVK